MRQLAKTRVKNKVTALESAVTLISPNNLKVHKERSLRPKRRSATTHRNLDLGFDLATSLAGARNIYEIVAFQTTYWRSHSMYSLPNPLKFTINSSRGQLSSIVNRRARSSNSGSSN